MSNQEASWKRLRNEAWVTNQAYQSALREAKAKVQSIRDGTGDVVYDEYSTIVERMPANQSPEMFLQRMTMDLNGTINSRCFDRWNIFSRRKSGSLAIGEIVDINIAGPDNGSVAVAEIETDYFVFQTVIVEKSGSHPEYGSREFGFEHLGGDSVRFYTRGASRPANCITGLVGHYPQYWSWTCLVEGIENGIKQKGGAIRPGALKQVRKEVDESSSDNSLWHRFWDKPGDGVNGGWYIPPYSYW